MQTRILNRDPRLFFDLALDTLFRRFPFFKLSTQPIPLAFMNVIGLFVSVNHQCFAVVFDVAERGEDHIFFRSPILEGGKDYNAGMDEHNNP